MKEHRWRKKDGEFIFVSEMSDLHIKNCIDILKRSLDNRPGEQVYMGESFLAEKAVEMENSFNNERAYRMCWWIKILNKELKRRAKDS